MWFKFKTMSKGIFLVVILGSTFVTLSTCDTQPATSPTIATAEVGSSGGELTQTSSVAVRDLPPSVLVAFPYPPTQKVPSSFVVMGPAPREFDKTICGEDAASHKVRTTGTTWPSLDLFELVPAGAEYDITKDMWDCDGWTIRKYELATVEPGPSCPAGLANCNHRMNDGCETNINTDPDNCGACGNACDPDEVCVNGLCVPQA